MFHWRLHWVIFGRIIFWLQKNTSTKMHHIAGTARWNWKKGVLRLISFIIYAHTKMPWTHTHTHTCTHTHVHIHKCTHTYTCPCRTVLRWSGSKVAQVTYIRAACYRVEKPTRWFSATIEYWSYWHTFGMSVPNRSQECLQELMIFTGSRVQLIRIIILTILIGWSQSTGVWMVVFCRVIPSR